MRVAVVGGGVAGLACARTLKDHGCLVTVFDKGREVGGRLSVRDSEAGAFDHGGPAFGVTDERFARCVRSWIDEGACGVWRPSVGVIGHGRLHPIDEPRPLAVGAPGMSAVCAHLASDVDVERSITVTSIERTDGAWSITVQPYKEDMRTIAGFDAVVLAGASPQSARLVATLDTPVGDALAEAAYQPQWVLMGTLEGGGSLCDVIRCADHEAIDKIVREGSKPGRDGGTRVVVHAMADWSRARYEADRDEIARELTGELERVLGSAGIKCTFVADHAHRWGFARPTAICDQQCAWDGTINLAACGDGFAAAVGDNASRIEDGVQNAYLSGVAAAGRVLSARPVRTVSALADDQDAPSLFASND